MIAFFRALLRKSINSGLIGLKREKVMYYIKLKIDVFFIDVLNDEQF